MIESIPEYLKNKTDDELIEFIKEKKALHKENIFILGHHYQRDQIINLCDIKGDSFELAKRASENENARFIIFCGVRFMAEAAAVLSKPHQIVQHPDVTAGCPLADMADINDVEIAWKELDKIVGTDNITPLTYMNSDTNLKAFCGKYNGSVTTSSNCKKIFEWYFDKKEKIFFFPDENLGMNTALSLGISEEKILVWNPEKELGGNSEEQIRNSKVILWNGFCHVHTFFTPEHVALARNNYPGIKIIVHPESDRKVVDIVDENGSTAKIIKYVEDAPEGSIIAVGTETNLVMRAARENPDKTVFPLHKSICPNMMKIGLLDLAVTLEKLGNYNIVHVDENSKKHARTALQNMLDITAK
ncbi:quinolinate synthase NadA [candidate division KSB1 bacterium]